MDIRQIVTEIKEMNTVFERPEGRGADREQEFSYFLEERGELQKEWVLLWDLIWTLDALVDICVFAVGALHKDGRSTEEIVRLVQWSWWIDIRTITTSSQYQQSSASILKSTLETLITLVWESTMIALFHEVYLSNMSKLKDGKPIPGNLPWKFGKNMDTYFKPDLKRVLWRCL